MSFNVKISDNNPIGEKESVIYKWLYCLCCFTITAVSLWIANMVENAVAGDAAIYYTFFKNFFTMPFSYFPYHVSYGGTSALFVVLGGLLYPIARELTFIILKYISCLFGVFCILLINRATGNKKRAALIVPLIFMFAILFSCKPFYIYIGQGYEIALVLLFLSLLYYFVMRQKEFLALVVCGVLYLVRPELSILSVVFYVYLLIKTADKPKYIVKAILSLIPTIIFTLYMYVHTGDLLPSTVTGRTITALETDYSWGQAFTLSAEYYWQAYGIQAVIAATALAVYIFKNRKLPVIPLLLLAGIILPYIIVPPTSAEYVWRYLVGVVPLYLIAAAYLSSQLAAFIIQKGKPAAAMAGIIAAILIIRISISPANAYAFEKEYAKSRPLSYALGQDLSEKLNPILSKNDKLLIYEIQMQYNIIGRGISLDAIVGSEMTDFLLKKETLKQAIERLDIDYIVTMSSFNYRHIFKDTELVVLYNHDLISKVGDSIEIDGVIYTKVITNEAFSNPDIYTEIEFSKLNNGDNYLRGRGPDFDIAPSTVLSWNSVYKIDGIF